MIQRRWQLFLVFLLFSHNNLTSAANTSHVSLNDALKTQGTVIMFRHAIAPGFGDPSNFRVEDCSTQRNLDSRGQDQSRAIGSQLRASGYAADVVFSSPWCRCLETAQLMDIGPVRTSQGLGSFFEGHVDRNQTLKQLSQQLNAIANAKQQPVIMVTHQVVISAVTGLGTSSGEAILYDPQTDQSRRVRLNNND